MATMAASSPDIHLHRVMLSKHRRGPWSSAEDALLLDLVRTQGASNWVRISQLIATRSPKQCRERFHQNLKPTLNLEPITQEEGVMIERMVAEMGKRWAEIARRLHGRSDNAVKNWWNGGMNRRKRLDNRRSDAPRHHQQHALQHQHSAQMQYAPHPSQVYDHHYAQPHQSSYAAPLPQQPTAHTYSIPSPTTTTLLPRPSTHRYDAPLPSPSALSTASRAESAEGAAPPSLVSDGSYSTVNPETPPQQAAETLPRLSVLNSQPKPSEYYSHRHYRSPTASSYHLSSYAITSSSSAPSPKPDYTAPAPQSQRVYPLLAERWNASAASSPVPARQVYTGPQLPLPSFSTIVNEAQAARRSATPESHKDGRMDLSKMLL